MFKNLFNLAYKRSFLEAFGFYVIYLVIILISAALLGMFMGLIFPQNAFRMGLMIASYLYVLVAIGLSLFILFKKNLLKNIGYFMLAILSGFLAYYFNIMTSLVIISYLTTLPENK